MKGEIKYCPICGEPEYLDAKDEIKCRSCDFIGNPQIVSPMCPVCQEVSLGFGDGKVMCAKCGYTASAEKASLDCIYKVLGYIEKENEVGGLRHYVVDCPDCNGDAVYDPKRDVVFCYTCGEGWTNTQFRECKICGEIKLRGDLVPNGICEDCEWEMEEREKEDDEVD